MSTAVLASRTGELACEPLLSCESLLMASLVELEDGPAVELGRRAITSQGVLAPFKPLRLAVGALPRVRRLAEQAVARLPATTLGDTPITLFVEDGDLGAALTFSPEEGIWFSLVRANGTEVVAMPIREADVLTRVLRTAEQQLADRGLAPLDRGAAH